MADFFQNGLITTLQNVVDRPIDDIENEIRQYSTKRNIALLLPALYSEFEKPAMHKIISELMHADYIKTIILSLDQANKKQFLHVKDLMSDLPQDVKIVWNHGERIQNLYEQLLLEGFPVNIPGKGRVVWMAMGYILSDSNHYAIALHDCDILNYKRDLVAKLVYPIVHRGLSYEFSKGYYARVTDKLYGRVTRLFFSPLIRSLKIMTGFQSRFLDYLDSFRYALSGEFAFIRELARDIRISPNWGLEVSMLSEVFQNSNVNRICQVEIMDTYEHKHGVLSKAEPNKGLLKMTTDITKNLLRILSQEGIIITDAFCRTLSITYTQEARKAISKYNALAKFNGLGFDRHDEIRTVEAFLVAINNAKDEFIENPVGVRLISPWLRVESALPDFMDQIQEFVEMDNKN